MSGNVTAEDIIGVTKFALDLESGVVYQFMTMDEDAYTDMSLWDFRDAVFRRDALVTEKGKEWFSIAVPRSPEQWAYFEYDSSHMDHTSVRRYVMKDEQDALILLKGIRKSREPD